MVIDQAGQYLPRFRSYAVPDNHQWRVAADHCHCASADDTSAGDINKRAEVEIAINPGLFSFVS